MIGYTVTDHADLTDIFIDLRARYAERDSRHDAIEQMLRREWDLKDSAGDNLMIASANMIRTISEDTSEAAATMPTIRVRPHKQTQPVIAEAAKMEQIALSYATANQLRTRMPRFVMDHLNYGFTPFIILPDPDTMRPAVYKRSPKTCFPEMPVYPTMIPRRVLFSEQVGFASLGVEEQEMLIEAGFLYQAGTHAPMIVKMEYVTCDQYVTGYLYSTNRTQGSSSNTFTRATWTPVITMMVELKGDHTPAVIIARDTFDDEHRGLFDDVIDPQLSHAKLLAMAIDYADQSVYSDMWAKDVMGDTAFGGGSFIELGPNGAIGRVPPASASLDLWRDIDKLEENIHFGARSPKSRAGQIKQSQASGKFVETTVGTMNTELKAIHEKFAEGYEAILHLLFECDTLYFGSRKQEARGTKAGEDFYVDYVPGKDIDLKNDIDAEYGLGLGRDSQESAMLMMKYNELGLVSDEFVVENTEGMHSMHHEKQRVDLQKLEQMMFASLLEGIEKGEIEKDVLAEIYRERESGKPLVKILEDMFKPEEVVEPPLPPGAAPGLGLPPGGAPPGMGPEGPAALPPPPPEAAALMAAMGAAGPGGPPPGAGPPGLPPGRG